MANDAAWQAGIDIAQGKSRKKKDGDDGTDSSSKPTGGLLGLASGAIKAPKARNTLKKAQFGESGLDTTQQDVGALIPQAKKGGRVKKGGLVRVHAGELIVPAKHRSTKKASRKRTVTKV